MNLDVARRVAQEAREDVGAFGVPRHSTHDLADLVDALAGEVHGLTGELYVMENMANGHAQDSFVFQKKNAELSQRLEEAHEALRFYADLANNRPHLVVAGSSVSEVDYDHGAKARVALSGEREDEKGDD